jgi:hypothetical protein
VYWIPALTKHRLEITDLQQEYINMTLPVQAEKVQSNKGTRNPLARFGRKWGMQIGIVAVALVVWLTFVVAAPRTFLSGQIYQAFMQTTAK